MRLYRKEGDVIQIISFPEEPVNKGGYLLVEDQRTSKALIVQVVDIQFANVPGILEDLLRDTIAKDPLNGEDYDPFQVSSQINLLKDTRLLICKIRGTIEEGRPTSSVSWLPSRVTSRIAPFPIEAIVNSKNRRPIEIGKTASNASLLLNAEALDGALNIITGKKGTGKSHLSKLLVLCLVDLNAPCLILDVNGEYVNLSRSKGTGSNRYKEKITVLTPSVDMKFTLHQVGLRAFLGMLMYALELPSTSARVFLQIWHELEKNGKLSLSSLGEAIQKWNCHESVRDAIVSRHQTIVDSGIFTDSTVEGLDMGDFVARLRVGKAVVVNLKNKSSMVRRMIVELLTSKLTELLSSWKLKAIFLFAEEAHLYLRETYWDDIVTRMRHLGVFTTFITNQPDTIKDSIYRQADNVFLFNFSNERDLEAVSKAAKIDSESIRLIAKDLPPHHCLAIGEIVRNFPLVVNVRPLDVETMGETRLFFKG